MALREWIQVLGQLLGERTRRASTTATRAHVEFRNLQSDELTAFAEELELSAAHLTRAEWFEVQPHTQRVVFAFEENAYDLEQLVAVVEAAEQGIGAGRASFAEGGWDHPADSDLGARRVVELVADTVGMSMGIGLVFSPIPALPLSGNAVAMLSILRGAPRLRRGLEERLGRDRAEFVLNLASSMAQGVAQRPLSCFVDGLHKAALLRELHGRRLLWQRRQLDLLREPSLLPVLTQAAEPRPCPLPKGPIEEYADRAWFVSLSGFALSFLTTRSFQRATAALFGGLPRPARIGRDVFAAQLNRAFARRGILSLDREVLRRLDRIDCLVLQGDLVSREKFVISAILTEDPETADEARERARAMFDPEAPLLANADGLWRLGPWALSDAQAEARLTDHAEGRCAEGALVLALERAGRTVAIVEVEIVAQTGVEELITAAHAAQMRVVVAQTDASLPHGLNADDVISVEEGVRSGIRRLQRDGHGVCVVGTGDNPGLPIADCGIGLIRDQKPVPWGADFICSEDLADVRYIIAAATAARNVSRQCVNIALGAATLGTLVSAGGLLPLTTRRVMFVINSANLISMANGVRNSVALERKALPEPRDPTPWHALEAEGVLKRLGTSEEGLLGAEVVRRRPTLPKPESRITRLGEAITDELFNPLAPLLAVGAGLSAVVGSLTDAGMVAAVVGLNAVVGGGQRFRVEQQIEGLTEKARVRARVKRNGRDVVLDAEALVPGDLVLLRPGDVVPADCRIIRADSLEVDASSLTGESLPVPKSERASFEVNIADRSSMLYGGTAVAAGSASAVVVAVGSAVEASRAQAVAKNVRVQGGVEQRLRSLMDLTGPLALAAGVGVVGGGLLRGRSFSDLVGSAVSLAVASVPEGLPLLATAAQLSAAQRLSYRNALVRNVRSIEALGRVDVICFDKTGTVTEGRIEVGLLDDGERREAFPPAGEGELSDWASEVLGAALRARAPAILAEADPIEQGLLRAGDKANLGAAVTGFEAAAHMPLRSGRLYVAQLRQSGSERRVSVKGASEHVLPMCSHFRAGDGVELISDEKRFALAARVARLAAEGLRVLAVAEKPVPADFELEDAAMEGFVFVGFVGFLDPVRPTAEASMRRLKQAGIRPILITGDHPNTATAVPATLGLPFAERVLTGAELSKLSDGELDQRIFVTGVYARVAPAQKARIVRALSRAGRVVAMVGDGANDAPAIRLADVGVAVGEQSTSAARGAADLVLVDGQLDTLIDAISEGRSMWASVRDAVSILLGGNLGEIGFTTLAGLFDGRPPLNARQLLLVNLMTDVAPAMAIALRPPSKARLEALVQQHKGDTALDAPLDRDIVARAITTALGAGGAWWVARLTGTRARARTISLAALVGTQLGQTLTSGGFSQPVLITGFGSAGVLFFIIQTPGLSHFFGCRPLGPFGWATAVGASAVATGLSHYASTVAEQRGPKTMDALFGLRQRLDRWVTPPGLPST